MHTRFCKKILGVKKTTQNDFVYGELGRVNYATKRLFIIVKYWFKILTTPENKYVKIIYNMMLADLEELPNKTNWASLVRDLLTNLGFHEVWLLQGVGNVNIFLSELKLRLNDTFIQKWHERLGNSSRARFYNTIAQFHFQPYLCKLSMFKYIQATSRLRMSSHRLAIESGRWTRPNRTPVNERICVECGVVEDEYHFVIECKLFNELRIKYLPRYFWVRSSMYKFVELLHSENINHIRKLGTYTYHAFKMRTDILYRN